MKKMKIAFVLNICIFAFVVLAIAWMMSGISSGVLTASRLWALRYFTVDSNILMGIAALIAFIDQRKVLKGKKEKLSVFTYVAKLTGTVGVTLTMLITIFFLAPTMGATYGVLSLFINSNFFMHLLNPILSIVVFLGFERTNRVSFKHTFTGIIPLVIYAIYYTAAALTHIEDGAIAPGYDWYGFFFLGLKSAFIVLPLIIIITYVISLVLWKLNRRKTAAEPDNVQAA